MLVDDAVVVGVVTDGWVMLVVGVIGVVLSFFFLNKEGEKI